MKTPPSADGLPLIGVLPRLLVDAPRTLARIAYAHPNAVVRIPFGPVGVYLVTDPPHVEHVLHDNWRNYTKGGSMWRPLRRLLGNGLVTAEGDEWVANRRVMQPLFSSRHLASLADLMAETIDRTLRDLERSRGPVDMGREMTILTQNVVLEMIFGTRIARHEADRLSRLLAAAFQAINLRLTLSFLPERLRLPGENKLERNIRDIDQVLMHLYYEHSRSGSTEGKSLLSLLKRAADADTGPGMSEQQIRDELVTLWVAGNETTAMVMTWIWVLLDKHSEVDARVRAEVADVLGGRVPGHEDVARMPYCKMVIQEAMRLYPPSWIIPRQCVADDLIGDYRIPAGSTVLLSQYVTHRNPSLWPQPDAFDPERFSPERSADRHRFAFMAFGGGPRLCVGASFAMMEAQLILAMMIQRFRPRLATRGSIRPVSATTLRPKDRVLMRLDKNDSVSRKTQL